MSLSQQTIEMHFKEIVALAEQIEIFAKDLGKVGQEEISSAAIEMKRGWESECSRKLVEKELKLAEQIRVEGDVLCKIAEEMKKQAEEVYRMEMLNVALAVTRIY